MGDCLMACWAATSVRRRFPEGVLVWAVEERCAEVIPPSLAVVEAFSRPRRKGFLSPAAWVRQYRCYARLRSYRFDVGIDLHGHLKTAFCLRLSGARRRVALRATDAVAARLNPVVRLDPMPEHEVERHIGLLRTLGDFGPVTDPDGFARPPCGSGPRIATIMTGASRPEKRMSSEQIRSIADLVSRHGYEVELVGGAGDPDPPCPGCATAVGKLTAREVMDRIARSAVHIAPDTWTGHAAAAYGTPVVSVFGEGRNTPERYRPYTERGVILRAATPPDVEASAIADAVVRLVPAET